jgi:epoxyqueuosine reductase
MRGAAFGLERSGQGSANDLAPRTELINPALEELAALEYAGWERLVNGSPMRRAGFDGLRRNLAIAMGNSRLGRYRARLEEWANAANSEALTDSTVLRDSAALSPLQSAARWALARIAADPAEESSRA